MAVAYPGRAVFAAFFSLVATMFVGGLVLAGLAELAAFLVGGVVVSSPNAAAAALWPRPPASGGW